MPRIIILFIIMLLGAGCLLQDIFAQNAQPSPESAQEHYNTGVFYGKQEKYEEAVMELEKAIALQPAYADAYNALGVVYYLQKDDQKAIEQYLLAIEADPKQVKARTNLAILYQEQGEYRKAVQQIEKALEINPTYELAKNLLDEVRKKADEQEAKALERQQAEAKRLTQPQATPPAKTPQKSAQFFFEAGTKLVRQGKLDAGIQEYRTRLERDPRSAEGYALLAMAYREKYRLTNDLKWRQEEIAAFTRAIHYDSKHVPALLGLGEIFYEQGEFTKAIPYFQKVLQYAPNHPARAQLEAIIGQPQ